MYLDQLTPTCVKEGLAGEMLSAVSRTVRLVSLLSHRTRVLCMCVCVRETERQREESRIQCYGLSFPDVHDPLVNPGRKRQSHESRGEPTNFNLDKIDTGV